MTPSFFGNGSEARFVPEPRMSLSPKIPAANSRDTNASMGPATTFVTFGFDVSRKERYVSMSMYIQ